MAIGYQMGIVLKGADNTAGFIGASLGLLGAALIIFAESARKRVSVRGLSSAVFGLIFGLLVSRLLLEVISFIPVMENQNVSLFLRMIVTTLFCYLGMVIALRGRDEFNLIVPYVRFSGQEEKTGFVILDTSVIIDGRIADMLKTNFIEDKLILPRFVLKELHQIADSSDTLRRNRGRRGLDVLNRIRKDSHADVKIDETEFPQLKEVDEKLIRLAKILNVKILTNDFNLGKVAGIQGVKVLNVNELANFLKPIVLPGEKLELKIIKEGKEHNQGVGYLNDGTMVVLENGRGMIGQTLTVVISSVIQTQSGKMIFTKLEKQKR
jgi:uncharacterized protein YacL